MQKIIEQIKKIDESKLLVKVLYFLGIVIIAKVIFFAGVTVGFHKASFGAAWGKHYNENFGMGHREDRDGRMNGTKKMGMMDYFPNAHGATGKIIKIELPSIIVQDKDNIEKVILMNSDTKIQEGRKNIAPADLQMDNFVVIIGTPNEQGQIEAKLIRVIPNPLFLNR